MIIKIVSKIAFVIAQFALWFLCFFATSYAVEFAFMERYQQGDTANSSFQILVQDEHGIHTEWLTKRHDQQILVQQEQKGNGYRLRQIAPDTYELFADLDTAMMTQTYRIENNKQLIPLSFRMNSIGSMILVMPLSFVVWLLANLGWRLARNRLKNNRTAKLN